MGKMNVRKAREELHRIADNLDRAKKTQGLAEVIRDIVETCLYRAKPKKTKKRK